MALEQREEEEEGSDGVAANHALFKAGGGQQRVPHVGGVADLGAEEPAEQPARRNHSVVLEEQVVGVRLAVGVLR